MTTLTHAPPQEVPMDDEMRALADRLIAEPTLAGAGVGPGHMVGALSRAEAHLAAGRAEDGLQAYALLVLGDPAEPVYQRGLGRAAIAAARWEMALQAASCAVFCDPDNAEGFLLSGMACLGLGEVSAAREDFADALRLATDAGDADLVARATRCLDGAQGLQ
ncbi:MAG: hypothetical protein ACU0BF_00790 [Paracoccaceae bacterium]